MKTGNKTGTVGKLMASGVIFSCIAAIISLLAGLGKPDEPARPTQAAWGSESLSTLHDGLQSLSPVALANACGLGASSCFKCHNGRRAIAPSADPAKAPWHVQHREVNNSCAGCHKGNPRIMMKDLSHNGMIKAPIAGADVCGDCHKTDRDKVEAAYKAVYKGGK
jgi:hypothetical protein